MGRLKGWYIIIVFAFIIFAVFVIDVVKLRAEKRNLNPYGALIEFEATAYCETGNQTKSGTWPMEGRTIAVDPSIIPLGMTVLVYNADMKLIGIYQAEDTGGKVKGRIIDIYIKNVAECWEFGRQKVFVQIVDARG